MNGAQRSNQQVLCECDALVIIGQQAIAAAEREANERNRLRSMKSIAALSEDQVSSIQADPCTSFVKLKIACSLSCRLRALHKTERHLNRH
jgi:hypothetical protein